MNESLLNDESKPFSSGTYRMVPTVNRRSKLATATWIPQIPVDGRYAEGSGLD